MKILLILNPISGDIDKTTFLEEAEQFCFQYGIEFHIFKTTGHEDVKHIKQIVNELKPHKIITAGGDGTVLITAKAIQNTSYSMGIIPLGSANGMATELGIKAEPIEEFKHLLLSNLVIALDLVQVNDETMIHIGDVGANANVVGAFANDEARGLGTYAKYLFEELQEQEVFQFMIKANGEVFRSEGIMIAICNARKYGTGIPINTVSNPLDGKFELAVIENIHLSDLIKAGLSTWDDKFMEDQHRLLISTEQAEITFDKPRLLQLDGEVIGIFEKLNIQIQAQSVRLLTHRENLNRTNYDILPDWCINLD